MSFVRVEPVEAKSDTSIGPSSSTNVTFTTDKAINQSL